jgi:hypothetical protein
MANETAAELTAKIQELEEALKLASTTPTSKKAAKSDWDEGTFKSDE